MTVMTTLDRDCDEYRASLGPLVDGELPGAEMLRIADHLEVCVRCRTQVEGLRRMGSLIREGAGGQGEAPLAGLQAGVLARWRAEDAQSWRGLWDRAVADWHWAIVGVGSLAATAASMLLVWAVFAFGPPPERSDSLAAVLNDLSARSVTSFVVTRPDAAGQSFSGLQNGRAALVGASLRGDVVKANFLRPSERDLVDALAAVLTPEGRLLRRAEMGVADWQRTENLLSQIRTMRVSAWEVRLFTSASVSARRAF